MKAMNKNLWQAVKFTLFSISAGIIQVLSFALLHDVLGLESYWMSHVPSLVLSVIWNFTFNRRYTFRSDAPLVRSMLLVALFYVVFTPASAWWGTLLERAVPVAAEQIGRFFAAVEEGAPLDPWLDRDFGGTAYRETEPAPRSVAVW